MRYPRPRVLLAAALAAAFGASVASAQGNTTGAVAGTVTDDAGHPLESVQVRATNPQTGFNAGVLTNAQGRYTIAGLEVGTYTVGVRRIGFEPQQREDVRVTLSQTQRLDFQLSARAATLGAVQVTAEQTSAINPSHTGAVTTVTDSLLRRLPTLNRQFTDFVQLTPQVSTNGASAGGLSAGGVNNRYNNVQIDGTSETDVFGLGSTGQPGGQANGKSIGIESVKEYQVLLSPYDVRQGNFAGFLVNAVTKSGTNDFHGSVYGVGRNQDYTRKQTYITDYKQQQYGLSLGGPILKNRAFFFINPEFQTRTTPASGPYVGLAGTNLTQARVDSFATILKSFGYSDNDIGSAGLVNNHNPLQNMFTRFDVNLPYNTQLVLRHNYGYSENDIFSRSASSFQLFANGYHFQSTKNAPALQLRTLLPNGMYNELLTGLTSIRDRRAPRSQLAQVTTNTPGFGLIAGAERSSQGNELDQDLFEVTDNFTIPIGNHRVTFGTQNQFMKFRNLFAQNSYGAWTFGSLDSLAAGLPNQYLIGVPLGGGDGAVRIKSNIYSGYVQDEWNPSPSFNVQAGLRADVPTLRNKPPETASVLYYYGRNTSDVPSGNITWSPRIGFNWDVTKNGVNQVRGGIGSFAGRPAYVWVSNAYQNSGSSGFGQLTCSNPRGATTPVTPAFTAANATTPPTSCANGLTAKAGSEIDLFRSDTRYPTTLKTTLGYDRRIGNTWVATVEGVYTQGINGLFYKNIALKGVQNPDLIRGKSAAEAGRWIYGQGVAGTGNGTPDTLPGGRTTVLDVVNQSKDHGYNFTGQLQHRYSQNFEGSVAYTYSRFWDVQSFTSSTAFSQYRFGRPWGGNELDLTPTRSSFEERHRIVATGTYTLPTHTDVSLIYFGEAGAPYGYTVNGDPNGDGVTQNDPIYVPTNALDPSQMQFVAQSYGGILYTPEQQAQAFENFIKGTPCLRENRGKLLPRNSCDNPFTNTVNLSARQSLKTLGMQHIIVQADIFNFLNLLNSNWGHQPSAGFGSQTLLDQRGLNGNLVTGHPIYSFNPGYQRFLSNNLVSNYQAQFQIKYTF